MIADLLLLLFLVIFVEAVTEILVDAKITGGLRDFIFSRASPPIPDNFPEDRDPPVGHAAWRFLNDLFSCGYCMSVWVSAGAALFAPRWLLSDVWVIGPVVNWMVMLFAIHRISNFGHVCFSILKKGRVKTYDIEIVHKHQVLDNGSTGPTGGPQSPSA